MKKWLLRALILIVLASTAGCYLAPRTSWTPEKYKKKKLNTGAPKTRR